jgi:hypothetical protein
MANTHDITANQIQVEEIAPLANAAPVNIKVVGGVQLEYDAARVFNPTTNPLEIPTVKYVNDLVTGGAAAQNVIVKPFLDTAVFPLVFSTTTDLAPFFNYVPDIIVREKTNDRKLKYRTDVGIVYDSVANTLTIDTGQPINGDVTIVGITNGTLTFLDTDAFPLVFNTALLPSYFTTIPSIIVREETAEGKYRYRSLEPVYDSVANTLTIDPGQPINGDVTFKKN